MNSPPVPDPTAAKAANTDDPIGLVAAFSWEVRRLLHRQSGVRKNGRVFSFSVGDRPVHLIVAGMGTENSYREARQLLERFRVRGLVTLGFAGALADSLILGDIVVADRVLDQRTGEQFDSDCELWPIETAHRGGLLSATEFIASVAEKRRLAGEWSAVAVDMESAGVARAAAESGVAFSVIKAITDTAAQSISIDFARCRSEHNGLSLWKIVKEGMRISGGIRTLWRLALGAHVAAGSLAAALGSPESRGTR